MKLAPLALVFALLALPVAAEEKAVTWSTPSGSGSGLLWVPAQNHLPAPAIVLLCDMWGLDGFVKKQAALLAGDFIVLAVDPYQGATYEDPADAVKAAAAIAPDRALASARSAVEWLRQRSDLKKDKVGILAYGTSARAALAAASVLEDKLKVVVVYYGQPLTERAAIEKIDAPVVAHFGKLDDSPTEEQVRTFEAALRATKKRVDIKVYPNAGHGFANPMEPWGGFDSSAMKDAWQRTQAALRINMLFEKR